MQYTVVLNKADTRERCRAALEVWEAMDHGNEMKVVVTGKESGEK